MSEEGVGYPTVVELDCRVNGIPVRFRINCPSSNEALLAARGLAQRVDPPGYVQAKSDERTCPIHGVPMRRHERDGDVWYSHRLADGTWCRGGE